MGMFKWLAGGTTSTTPVAMDDGSTDWMKTPRGILASTSITSIQTFNLLFAIDLALGSPWTTNSCLFMFVS